MSFHEVQFPPAISFGASGGPERRTEIVTLASGFEERNTPWADSRRRYDAGFGARSLDDLEEIVAFFEARRAQLHGFRWKDWTDFKSCPASADPDASDQNIGSGNGVEVAFQLTKTYESGGVSYVRSITKPVAGRVLVAVDGAEIINFACDYETGLVTLNDAPASGAMVTAGFEFDVPVRFDSDRIETSVASFNVGEIPSVPVVEVRV
jgi:uncharacterized protein (TIGR02217 family)